MNELLGRFIFILWDMDEKEIQTRKIYSQNTNGLQGINFKSQAQATLRRLIRLIEFLFKGRAFFTSFYYDERYNHTETMFVHMDYPDIEKNRELIQQGYITRTRINTEYEIEQQRYNDTIETGSQIISFGIFNIWFTSGW